jgi:hypothetical protein
MILKYLAFFFSFTLLSAFTSGAATLYVDNSLVSNCANNYSIANRACNGAEGPAYTTVQAAVNAMTSGDQIIVRGGTYQECVAIPKSTNGTAWTAGNYNKISSCNTESGCATNEWAVLDGNYSCDSNGGAVIGLVSSTETGSSDLKYWWLERLEIKNGRNAAGTAGYGFNGNGGPFKIRYCYIHDNKGTPGSDSQCDDLPGGTWGQAWHDSVIEFNWFADNGGTAPNNNCKQVGWIPSYALTNDVEQNGLTITDGHIGNGSYVVDIGNEIRYNYVTGGRVGIAPKHFTWLSGRNPESGHGYSDTYSDKGTKIHHNVLYNMSGYAIGAHGDFFQVYNNIVDTAAEGIRSQYDYWGDDNAYSYTYKVTAYNNTFMNLSSNVGYKGMGRRWADWIDERFYANIYNNLCDGCGNGADWCSEAGITPKMRCASETRTVDYSNTVIDKNYFYRPDNTSLYLINRTVYTNTTFEQQTETHTPRNSYSSSYDAGNLLYQGTSGADKYRIRAGHIIESTTAGAAGTGGVHPYLTGATLPSYIGAANPYDDAWVAGVLGLANIAQLRDAGSSDPVWIEDACANLPVRINNSEPGYSSISEAYSHASSNNTLWIQDKTFSGDLSFGNNIITLKGGYNCGFSSITGYSTISGKVTIGGTGRVTADRLIIK